MDYKKYGKDIEDLIYHLREYGIDHLSYDIRSCDGFPEEDWKQIEFFTQVHQGFKKAQDRVISLLTEIINEQKQLKKELAEARGTRDEEHIDTIKQNLNDARYYERVFRKIIDSIAWQLFNYDLSTMRQLYCGKELIDITDSNLDSEIHFAENYLSQHPDGFVLISDLSSFIQIGDVVYLSLDDGRTIAELKEGTINNKIFEIIDNYEKTQCLGSIKYALEKENKSFNKQFLRTLKQMYKTSNVKTTLTKGYGADSRTGQKVIIHESDLELFDYEDAVLRISETCSEKGYGIEVIEDCLLIGMYDVEKMPSFIFDIWAQSCGITMPIYDIRMSFFDPLSYPLYLHALSPSVIADLIIGKKVMKMTIAVEKWLSEFEKDGYKVRWLSKKETARLNGQIKNALFSLDGCGVEIKKGNAVSQIGEGIFSRMFTHFTLPSSLKELLEFYVDNSN